MKEKFNKSLFAGLMTIVVVAGSLVALGIFKGEAILFAITNEKQVMAEKDRWDTYIQSYGSPKE